MISGTLARSATSLAISVKCAGVAAVNRRQLVAADQAVGLGARDGRVALHVGEDQVELGAAERLDAAGLIDHLDRELGGIDASLSRSARSFRSPGKGRRCSRALPPSRCSGIRAERGGGKRAARGFDEEVSAAFSDFVGVGPAALFHLRLPMALK